MLCRIEDLPGSGGKLAIESVHEAADQSLASAPVALFTARHRHDIDACLTELVQTDLDVHVGLRPDERRLGEGLDHPALVVRSADTPAEQATSRDAHGGLPHGFEGDGVRAATKPGIVRSLVRVRLLLVQLVEQAAQPDVSGPMAKRIDTVAVTVWSPASIGVSAARMLRASA